MKSNKTQASVQVNREEYLKLQQFQKENQFKTELINLQHKLEIDESKHREQILQKDLEIQKSALETELINLQHKLEIDESKILLLQKDLLFQDFRLNCETSNLTGRYLLEKAEREFLDVKDQKGDRNFKWMKIFEIKPNLWQKIHQRCYSGLDEQQAKLDASKEIQRLYKALSHRIHSPSVTAFERNELLIDRREDENDPESYLIDSDECLLNVIAPEVSPVFPPIKFVNGLGRVEFEESTESV